MLLDVTGRILRSGLNSKEGVGSIRGVGLYLTKYGIAFPVLFFSRNRVARCIQIKKVPSFADTHRIR